MKTLFKKKLFPEKWMFLLYKFEFFLKNEKNLLISMVKTA